MTKCSIKLGYGDIEGPVPVPAVPVGPCAKSKAASSMSLSLTSHRSAAYAGVKPEQRLLVLQMALSDPILAEFMVMKPPAKNDVGSAASNVGSSPGSFAGGYRLE